MITFNSTAISRFWAKVNKDGPIPVHRPELGPCWLWTAGLFSNRYGAFQYEGKTMRAHKVSWFLAGKEIPDGLLLMHKCDNKQCVNDNHLEPGTQLQNIHDMLDKGRENYASGENHGHSTFTGEEVDDMRRRYRAGETQYAIADYFNTSQSVVSPIVRGKSWKHRPFPD